MNLYKSAIFPLLFAALGLGSASASVSFLVDAEVLADQSGAKLSVSSSVVMVVDTAGDGFGPVTGGTTTIGQFLNGSDDMVVFADTTGNTSGEAGVLFMATSPITLGAGATEPTTGEMVALYWFPGLALGGTISNGQTYGTYTDAVGIDGSEIWEVPADGTTNHTLAFGTTDQVNLAAGSNPPSAGWATNVVPEPSAFSLLALALAGTVLRRRRR